MEKDIGALWVKKGEKGEYMTGIVTIDNVAHKIVVFKNGYKKEANHPDWRIYPSKPKPELNENGTEKVTDVVGEEIVADQIPF